jgi:hypothetical protein
MSVKLGLKVWEEYKFWPCEKDPEGDPRKMKRPEAGEKLHSVAINLYL